MDPKLNGIKYLTTEHSGDLAITAWGSDKLEALANAASALVTEVVSLESIAEQDCLSVIISEHSENARIIAFLNEIVYLITTRLWLPARIKHLTTCTSCSCVELRAVLIGEPVDVSRHRFKYDIKAVTYHDFQLIEEHGRVTIHFVCDL